MSTSNPFFGQEVVSIDSGKKEVVGSFPNWGIMEEDDFMAALTARLMSRIGTIRNIRVFRLQKVGGPDPTFWVIKLE